MGRVNVDKDSLLIALKQLEQYESDLEAARAALNKKYQLLGSSWNDRKYQELGDIVSECNSALRTVQKSALLGEQSIAALIKVIQAYEDTNIRNSDSPSGNLSMASQAYEDNNADGEETSEGRPLTRHLSADEVNNLWMARVKDTDAMIENYREALLERGVPEGEWLNNTLADHRSRMLEQERRTLAATQDARAYENMPPIYQYPGDYETFYDNLAADYRQSCSDASSSNNISMSDNRWNTEYMPLVEANIRQSVATYFSDYVTSDKLEHSLEALRFMDQDELRHRYESDGDRMTGNTLGYNDGESSNIANDMIGHTADGWVGGINVCGSDGTNINYAFVTAVHENLHMMSANDTPNEIRRGIMVGNSNALAMNEALTEYLTFISCGGEGQMGGLYPGVYSGYHRLMQEIPVIENAVGRDCILDSYFNNNPDHIRGAVDGILGQGAWNDMCDASNDMLYNENRNGGEERLRVYLDRLRNHN